MQRNCKNESVYYSCVGNYMLVHPDEQLVVLRFSPHTSARQKCFLASPPVFWAKFETELKNT